MTTPDSARLETIARELQSTVRSLMAKAEHARNVGPHACREAVHTAILAALARVQPEPEPSTNIGADWDRARDARQDVVAEIPLTSLKAPAPTSVEGFYQRVNARAEADILAGGPVAGALHRAMQVEIAAFRGTTSPAGEPR